MPKIVGQAVALQRAYYPLESGHCRIVEPGETFDLVEGHTEGNWFTPAEPIEAPKAPATRKAKAPAPAPEPEPAPENLA